ncbi:MAG: 4-hydroxy-tetrahydrodipicolinate reductase [Alphaproteobacteria bacterium]|nr:4-hydroxy-tetrahydrodipicolinate reductase [Alphaproteobacteria bacterium]
MLNIAVAGATGRMGRLTLKEITEHCDVEITGVLTRSGNPLVGSDAAILIGMPPINISITDSPKKAFVDAHVIIDFSHPEGLELHLLEALQQEKPYVVCMTGLSNMQQDALKKAAFQIPILLAPNTSFGIALLKQLIKITSKALGPSYDISLLEMHHRHKADAPSGTALSLAKALVEDMDLNHNSPPYPSQSPRLPHTIECAVLRGGGVVGDHSVIFAGEKDMITLEHRTLDPSLFSQGAIKGALWLKDKVPGLYTIDHVLGFCQ